MSTIGLLILAICLMFIVYNMLFTKEPKRDHHLDPRDSDNKQE